MPEAKKKPPINYQYILQTRRMLVIAFGLAGVTLFVGMAILIPNLTKARTAYANLNAEKGRLANLERKNSILQNVQNTDLYSKKSDINAILPSSKPLLQLLNQIDRVSAETGVIISEFGVVPGEISTASGELKTIKPPVGANPNLGSIETQIILIGKIENVNSFLKAINNITPLTETTELALKAINRQDLVDQQKLSDPHVFEATLTLTSYFFTGKIQTDPNQDLPDLSKFTNDETAELDQFQVPVSSQIPANPTVGGGGKEDLFQ
ncbi:MAG: hypothetical protein ABI425_04850 [Patescibacteria group bacterium]